MLAVPTIKNYHPITKRYIQSDPIGFEGGVNTYLYAGANPVVRFDESGEYYWKEFLIFIALLKTEYKIYKINCKIRDMLYVKEELEKFRDEVLGCNNLSWSDKHFIEKQKMCEKLDIELAKILQQLGSKIYLKTIGEVLY